MGRTRRALSLLLLVPALGALGCGAEKPRASRPAAPAAAAAPKTPAAAPSAARASGPTVVFLGDSLTAGFKLEAEEAYPARVEKLLAERGLPVRAVNAGISGDTSAGGLERLDWLLAQHPAILFVCLGANDGLRGLPLESTEANLRAIVERARGAGATVVLAGMQMPPNYGPEYTAGFRAIYPRLASEYKLPFVPFLLEGVAARPELTLRDGLHPNAEGQKIIARNVADALAPLLREKAAA
jgi:acyl-CoA thioesterase-1